MARRAEFYHDPLAPKANSMRPTAFAAVRDGSGRLLLVRRADTLNRELPGGKVEPGESGPAAELDTHPSVRLRIDHAVDDPDIVHVV